MPISNRRTAGAIAILAAACALTLSACGPDDATSGSSASSSAGQSGASGDTAGTATPSGNGKQSDGAPASVPSANSTDSGTTGGSSGTPRCHTQDLKIAFETGGDAAPDMTSDKQQTTGIAVTNHSGHACLVGGFAGVDLNGGSTNWSLPRSSTHYSSIKLDSGDTTDFQITFMPQPGGSWTPKSVTVTPPNETTSATLTWPWGPVLLQDGATHPGSFVGPIG